MATGAFPSKCGASCAAGQQRGHRNLQPDAQPDEPIGDVGIVYNPISKNTIIVSAGHAKGGDASAVGAVSASASGLPVLGRRHNVLRLANYNNMPEVPIRITALVQCRAVGGAVELYGADVNRADYAGLRQPARPAAGE
jgi:hypothetical protein